MSRYNRFSHHFDKMEMEVNNEYGIPVLFGVRGFSLPKNWIPFSQAMSFRGNFEETGVHFYIDDYQFERVWKDPQKYVRLLRRFRCVVSPDFSLFRDFPWAMQCWWGIFEIGLTWYKSVLLCRCGA